MPCNTSRPRMTLLVIHRACNSNPPGHVGFRRWSGHPDLLPLLGVHPAMGRGFNEEDASPSSPPVAIISHGYWQRRFGGDPEVLGSTMTLSGDPVSVVGIPLLAGRDVREQDRPDSGLVMVISESMAREFYPDGPAVGQPLMVDVGEVMEFQVIGVVGDARLGSVTGTPYRTMYAPYFLNPSPMMRMALRTSSGDPERLIPEVRNLLKDRDPEIPLAGPSSMQSVVDRGLAGYRVVTRSLGLFALLALFLTGIGLYSVLANYVAERRGELGIRKALGADSPRLVRLVVGRGLLLVLLGIVPGLVAAAAATRLIRQILYETPALDPAAYAGAALFVLLATGMASLLPAIRAVRVDPVRAFRTE